MPSKKTFFIVLAAAALASPSVSGWPSDVMERLSRDARRLLPKSLAMLIASQEREILDEVQRLPPQLELALGGDLASGRLGASTLDLIDGQARDAVDLLRRGRVTEGILMLGALARVPADVADPVLTSRGTPFPPEAAREYYAFLGENLGKIPVVLDDPVALTLKRDGLGAYWQSRLLRSRDDSGVLLPLLTPGGRVVDHRTIDYRSPVFAVASLAYSRAVTGIAATWLALWRDAQGDLTRMPRPTEIRPRAPASAPRVFSPSPEARRP